MSVTKERGLRIKATGTEHPKQSKRGLYVVVIVLALAALGAGAWLIYVQNADDTDVAAGTQPVATLDPAGEAERAEIKELVDDHVSARGAEDQEAFAELIADNAAFYYRDLRSMPPYWDDLWDEQSGQVLDRFSNGPFRFSDVVEGIPFLADTWYDTPPGLTIIGEPIEFQNWGGAWVVTFYAQTDATPMGSTVEQYVLWIWDSGRGEGQVVVAEYRTVLGAR